MRKIESLMNEAIINGLNWKSGNTEVKTDSANISRVFLYGNHIATIGENWVQLFDGEHQTATTKSRLNAICDANAIQGEGVFQKAGKWFVKQYNGVQLGWETVQFHSGIVLGDDAVPAV
jgi:hypothetical protein